MLMLDIANKPHLPIELVLNIAEYLDPVDLTCFRAVNWRLRRAIGLDIRGVRVHREPDGGQIFLHSDMDSRGKTKRKIPFPQVHVRPGLCDICTEWAISKDLAFPLLNGTGKTRD